MIQEEGKTSHDTSRKTVWLLVDHSARAEAFVSVAKKLEVHGVHAQIVTISEVIGTMAREAIAGGAERVLRGLRVAVDGRKSDEDLIGAVRRARPDVLVVTHAKYVRALSVLESLTGIPSLRLGVVSDYNVGEAWLKSGLHAFVVPHQELAARFERSGVDSERVLIAGPPVHAGVEQDLDAQEIRSAFGFSKNERVVLVRVEGLDVSSIEKVVFQSKLVEGAVRFVFHHNGDGTAASTLRRSAGAHGLQAIMFGRVHDLERYICASDLVLSTADDLMMAEIIALGKPVLMIGDERDAGAQIDFLEQHGMGRYMPELPRLGTELERLLRDETLAEYTKAASSIGFPGGSQEVAAAIINALEHAHDWRTSGDHDGSSDAQGGLGEGASQEQAPKGPFESIGVGSGTSSGAQSDRSDRSDRFSSSGREGARISHTEAKEQLAQLILMEREHERKLTELGKEQQRWRKRLDLAREWNEEDLSSEAESILRGYLREAEPLQQQLDDIRRQKTKLKEAAGAGRTLDSASVSVGLDASRISETERRFKKMEEDRELDDLKGRIDREFGD